MSAKPLLFGNKEKYRGPRIPTRGMSGYIMSEGMLPGDQVRIMRGDNDEVLLELNEARHSDFLDIAKANGSLRAQRIECTGASVHVWAALGAA